MRFQHERQHSEQRDFGVVVQDLYFCWRPIHGSSGQQSRRVSELLFDHCATVCKTPAGFFVIENQDGGVRMSARHEEMPRFKEQRRITEHQRDNLRMRNITLGQLVNACKGGSQNRKFHWIDNNCIHGTNRIRNFLKLQEFDNPAWIYKPSWFTISVITLYFKCKKLFWFFTGLFSIGYFLIFQD